MKTSSAFSLSISVLLFLCFSSALCYEEIICYPQDLKTLLQINAELGIKTPTTDCCQWDFVVCGTSHPFPVIELNYIDDPNVSGPIPAAVSELKSLFLVRFINVTNLIGPLPVELTKLPLLSALFVSQTGLSGPIPSFLINIKKLGYLDLSLNSLTGSIPPELSKSRTLSTIILSENKLTGTIPKSLGNLNLKSIDLSRNHFSGDPSFLFGKNRTITQGLKLSENNFSFDLSNVEFPQFLSKLNLSHNNIFGSLPKQLTELKLLEFDVSYNKLCGQIPRGGRLQKFRVDKYAHNKCLCGSPLPACK